MKREIKNKIKGALYVVIYLAFTFSGWVLYIISDIRETEKETSSLIKETEFVRDSVVHGKSGSERFSVSREYLDFVDRLIRDNNELQDSLVYYQTFYQLAWKSYDFEYEFTQKDSSGYHVGTGILVSHGLKNRREGADCDSDSLPMTGGQGVSNADED